MHSFFRLITFSVLATLVAGSLVACSGANGGASPTAPTSAAPVLPDPTSEGGRLADGYFAALKAGDAAKVGEILASGATIARANGDVEVRDEYLTNLPTIKDYRFSKMAASQSGDVLVVTYHVFVDEIVNGVQQPTKEAPRLTVFQWIDGSWKLMAHANFGAINPPPTP